MKCIQPLPLHMTKHHTHLTLVNSVSPVQKFIFNTLFDICNESKYWFHQNDVSNIAKSLMLSVILHNKWSK